MPTVGQLEKVLKALKGFESPKVLLEQYATDAHLASRMSYLIQNEYSAIEDKIVADFGCGSGVLTFAASLFDPLIVYSVDVDPDAFETFRSNMATFFDFGDESYFIEPILGDVLKFRKYFRLDFDTVISNPPFGTKNNTGIDVEFVHAGFEQNASVFSLHKSSTRSFLERKIGGKAIASMGFEIPKQFAFHQKENAIVEVDLVRFECINKRQK